MAGAYRVGTGISIKPTSTSPTVASGHGVIYPKSTDGDKLYYKKPNGSESEIGAASSSDGFDFSTWAQNHPLSASNNGDNSFGIKFQVSSASTATGAKIYWPGAATTIRVRLYSAAGASLATGTQVVTGSGLYTIDFNTPYSMLASTSYWVAGYDTNGIKYASVLTTEFVAVPFFASSTLLILDNAYAAGDVVPSSVINSQWSTITPVYTTP